MNLRGVASNSPRDSAAATLRRSPTWSAWPRCKACSSAWTRSQRILDRDSRQSTGGIVGEPDRTVSDSEPIAARSGPLAEQPCACCVDERERGFGHRGPHLALAEGDVPAMA